MDTHARSSINVTKHLILMFLQKNFKIGFHLICIKSCIDFVCFTNQDQSCTCNTSSRYHSRPGDLGFLLPRKTCVSCPSELHPSLGKRNKFKCNQKCSLKSICPRLLSMLFCKFPQNIYSFICLLLLLAVLGTLR